jgi:hypothetical protein
VPWGKHAEFSMALSEHNWLGLGFYFWLRFDQQLGPFLQYNTTVVLSGSCITYHPFKQDKQS